MSFLDRLQTCARFDPADYLPFLVDGLAVGLVRPEFARRLARFPDVFEVSAQTVHLARGLREPEQRTRALDAPLRALAAEGVFEGWRDEPYTVAAFLDQPPLFEIERAAIPRFGFWASGVHVNGIVRDGGEISMWIGRRSPDKQTSPNKLDQLVAGGRSARHSVRETVLKESAEEAGIPAHVAAQAVPVGAITYATERPEGLRRDVIYVFDLELDPAFEPRNHDGEIAEFQLWPLRRVLETVRDSEDFKFNCSLVVIDFLVRHGVIEPDDPDYLTMITGLHRR